MSARRGGIEQQIEALGRALATCFLLMALGLGYWGIVRAPALAARDDNPRRIEAERRIRRGDIYDREGRLLVRSEQEAGGAWNRVYLVPAAAPVVGFASINYGTTGIEGAYDLELRGERSRTPTEQIFDRLLHVYSSGVPMRLTLDLEAQQAAYEALGERTGAVVLLDVRSGELLAMVSKPTFDPNSLEEDWPDLQFDPDKPMLNRPAQGLYPPGVVFETVTLAAILEEGLAGPTTVFTDNLGVILELEPPVSCPADPPQGAFTLSDAYTWPCSVLFARLGLVLGGEQLADYATRLGVGRPLDLPLDLATGQVLERGVWTPLLAARTAMGQGEVLVTPLEMALVTAAIANDGVQPVPRLVLDVGPTPVPAVQGRQVLSAETARQIKAIMARAAADALVVDDIAGRAAATESGLPGAPLHSWFIGFTPVESPRYAIVVLVEYGNGGWDVAAPIALQVLRAASD